MSEGWPDFWLKGKYIELIDTINTVNLIKTIQQIDTVTNLGTLDTLNTVGTIQKINPQTINSTEYNTVIDLIKKINTINEITKINPQTIDTTEYNTVIDLIKTIQQIDNVTNLGTLDTINTVGTIQKINPTETENAVIDRIAKIDNVTNLGTLDTINTVGTIQKINPKTIDTTEYNTVIDLIEKIQQIDTVTNLGTLDTLNTIGTIQKINPQNTDNVVIDRVKLINTIETINNLGTLDTINTVDTINTIDKIKRILFIGDMPLGLIRNGGFESGTLEPWFPGGNVNITTDALIGDYAVSLAPGAALGQYIKPVPCHKFYIIFAAKSTVSDDTVTVKIFCTDGTELTRSETLGTGWNIYAKEYATDKVVYAVQFEAPSANSGNVIIDSVDAASYPQVQVYQAEKDRTINREGVYTSFSVSATGSGSTTIYTPSSGKKAKVIAWNFYCDSDVVCELRFSTSGNVIAGLPAKGATAMNLVGCTAPTGDTDETVEIYVSDAANVKGWICVTEV